MRPVFMDEGIKLKFFHLADLHIGKRVNGFPMREDLEHIFAQIYAYAQKHQPDAVLIAGDVYDKTLPSAEAVAQFDGFLTEVVRMGIPVVIISGNHDSPERLEFAKGILQSSRVYLSCTYYGKADCVTLTGEVPDVPDRLQAMDAMALPSLFEGFPNVLVEWQLAGLPALVSDAVTRECDLTGLLRYLPLDEEAWAEALAGLSTVDREAASRDGAEQVARRGYDVRVEAARLKGRYRQMLEEQRASRS